jgi:geranylgeranyl diphosphate synthase type II
VDVVTRIDRSLVHALSRAIGEGAPPGLANAMRYAVLGGGSRIRPRLCHAVARACGEDQPAVTDLAASAIELLHCASLVHDDLPCFDDAATRRGRPSLHRAFGESLAVLAGDALIVLAYESLAQVADYAPRRVAPLLRILGRAAGMPHGIVAGQAWESESRIVLSDYQRAKTGALFAAATAAGAAAAGRDGAEWHLLGDRLGEAYQVADDIRDVAADPAEVGKPVGRDRALGRPNAAGELGLRGACHRLESLVAAAIDVIPACPGSHELRVHIRAQADGLLPRTLARPAA